VLAILLFIYQNRKILTRKRRGKFNLPTVAPEKETKTKSVATAQNVLENGPETEV
jgi:hypothetical protein